MATDPGRFIAGTEMELIPSGPGPESLATHHQRLGPLPALAPAQLIAELEGSGLLGRGGAGFPVGRKWRSVAQRSSGGAVVLANGAEGEPLSHKDRSLMAARPQLVIDGALLAAGAVNADDMRPIVLEALEQPALIVWGDQDKWVNPKLPERLSGAMPGARLIRIPTAARLVPEDAPGTLTNIVLEFIGAASVV